MKVRMLNLSLYDHVVGCLDMSKNKSKIDISMRTCLYYRHTLMICTNLNEIDMVSQSKDSLETAQIGKPNNHTTNWQVYLLVLMSEPKLS